MDVEQNQAEPPKTRQSSDEALPAILREGINCWQKATAFRASVLVDGCAYFRAFREAALRAQHSIIIVGWDVSSSTLLKVRNQGEERSSARRHRRYSLDDLAPDRLGSFIRFLLLSRPFLRVYILEWDYPIIYAYGRDWMPKIEFGWPVDERLRFVFDSEHPFGASQHQKIVLIDDKVAFSGGIDLTIGRWDTPEHRPDDRRRGGAFAGRFRPYHDIQMAVDGECAHALASLARLRWRWVTGEDIPMSPLLRRSEIGTETDPWPPSLRPEFEEVSVGVARTLPGWKGHDEVREIERLFLDSIANAKRYIYFENQYWSSPLITKALKGRLEEPGGPEVVLVLPRESHGWLEETSVGALRVGCLEMLRAADHHGRLRVVCPVTGERGQHFILVHAKLCIIDDQFLRVGSANVCGRSMGLDSECDLAIEAEGSEQTMLAIQQTLNRLLAEHLDCPQPQVASLRQQTGSIVETIDQLRKPGRTLIPVLAESASLSIISLPEMLDPSRPIEPERIADALVEKTWGWSSDIRDAMRNALGRLLFALVILLIVGGISQWLLTKDGAVHFEIQLFTWRVDQNSIGIFSVFCLMVGGALLMIPLLALITIAAFALPPSSAFLAALGATLVAAQMGYGIGYVAGRPLLKRWGGSRIERLAIFLGNHGITAMAVIRILPFAPFALVNIAAGAVGVGIRNFSLGTIIGILPGLTMMVIFASRFKQFLRDPNILDGMALAGLSIIILGTTLWAWRRFQPKDNKAA